MITRTRAAHPYPFSCTVPLARDRKVARFLRQAEQKLQRARMLTDNPALAKHLLTLQIDLHCFFSSLEGEHHTDRAITLSKDSPSKRAQRNKGQTLPPTGYINDPF